jgi:hypothetical protein
MTNLISRIRIALGLEGKSAVYGPEMDRAMMLRLTQEHTKALRQAKGGLVMAARGR